MPQYFLKVILGYENNQYLPTDLKNTHHSQVIIHGLEGAAEQLAGFWVSDFSNASTILRVPDAQGPV